MALAVVVAEVFDAREPRAPRAGRAEERLARRSAAISRAFIFEPRKVGSPYLLRRKARTENHAPRARKARPAVPVASPNKKKATMAPGRLRR